ncbi:YchJ family protein [Vibrio sp. 99-70-13A1]|uniref:YchJ family protein n=1 Tax=Vibrio sp. 99-70-13A1 TaxID=2607601 RepID=UPI0014938C5B|nr:YchJ family protein [Vibrio sp. 99-70-13A1]NOH98207.1 YchJ family protein [Vibrio sp. 99-70-13A1]
MSLCPCCSNLAYQQCCEPAHINHSNAVTPEQLMRSRYSAHVLGLVDYVITTYHPNCNAEAQREGIAESINSDWAGLEVIVTAEGSHENEGFVEFKAYFNDGAEQFCMQERSRFVRDNGLWYYIDGTFPDQESDHEEPEIDPRLNQTVESFKIGRNDPCICGSGKKYKKCCG